jgi:DNA polymerase IV
MGRWPRVILHADMDAFFAAVEQLDRPELRGRPLLIGGTGRRAVVSTASYEARPFGVGSAMPMSRARRLCPQAIVVPPRFERYQEVSAIVMGVFGRFSPLVEPLSCDEAFIDASGTESLFGPPRAIGERIRREVREATGGLTVSVGIATTKFVAKVASDFHKPDGLTIVPPEETLAFLHPLPVRRLWGVGPHAAAELERLKLRTIGDVARAGRAWLVAELGSLGEHIFALAHAEDPRGVEPGHEAKSIGHEETLEYDIVGPEPTRPLLLRAADSVSASLRAERLTAGGVRVKLKTASFHLMTRQRALLSPTASAQPLYEAALGLLDEFPWEEPLRLVGLAAYQLNDGSVPVQQDLFAAPQERRRAQLDKAVDALRARFGDEAVRRASELPPPSAACDEKSAAKPKARGPA